MNIIKNRYFYFLISLLIIVPGLIFLILNYTTTGKALPLGIDFSGGSLLEVQFAPNRPTPEQVQSAYQKYAPEASTIIQPLGENAYSIRSKTIDDATKGQIVSDLGTAAGNAATVLAFSSVS